jgi:hypothetical protein
MTMRHEDDPEKLRVEQPQPTITFDDEFYSNINYHPAVTVISPGGRRVKPKEATRLVHL